jgi:hypothetical protein
MNVTVPLRKPPKYEVMLPPIVEMADAGSGVDLISLALRIGAEVVRDALHLHRTGKRPPPPTNSTCSEPCAAPRDHHATGNSQACRKNTWNHTRPLIQIGDLGPRVLSWPPPQPAQAEQTDSPQAWRNAPEKNASILVPSAAWPIKASSDPPRGGISIFTLPGDDTIHRASNR